MSLYVSSDRQHTCPNSHNPALISSTGTVNGWMVVQVGGFVKKRLRFPRKEKFIGLLCYVHSGSNFGGFFFFFFFIALIQKTSQYFKRSPIQWWCHRRDYFPRWRPPWHWSRLRGRRWKTLTGDAYLMLEQIIWFQCLNWPESCCCSFAPAQLTYLNLIYCSINQSEALCLFLCLENVQANVKRLIHTNVAQTLLATGDMITAILPYLYDGNSDMKDIKNELFLCACMPWDKLISQRVFFFFFFPFFL